MRWKTEQVKIFETCASLPLENVEDSPTSWWLGNFDTKLHNFLQFLLHNRKFNTLCDVLSMYNNYITRPKKKKKSMGYYQKTKWLLHYLCLVCCNSVFWKIEVLHNFDDNTLTIHMHGNFNWNKAVLKIISPLLRKKLVPDVRYGLPQSLCQQHVKCMNREN